MIGPFAARGSWAAGVLELPVDQELKERVAWLIRLRWLAAIALMVFTLAARPLFSLDVPASVLLWCGAVILLYNLVFWALLRITGRRPVVPPVVYGRFAALQIVADLILLTLIVYFTGGISSPALFFFLFHVIIASILLRSTFAFLQTLFGMALVAAMALSELMGLIPGHRMGILADSDRASELELAVRLVAFGAIMLVATFLATNITRQLARRTRELAELRQRRELDYEKIRTLYEVSRAVNSSLDLNEVLQTITQLATEAMSAKGCSVRLLDESRKRLELRAAYGLSEGYLNKGPIDAGRGLDRRVLAGESVCLSSISGDSELQYPQEARREGISSMLSVPLRAKERVIGVLRIYAAEERCFSEEEVEFLNTLARQSAVAIENASTYRELERLEQVKSRFIFTVSHDLKAPLAAIQSQLALLVQGYAGELNQEQLQLVKRAIARAEGLQTLVRDLLALGAIQSRLPDKNAVALDLVAVVQKVVQANQVMATGRGISFELKLSSGPLMVKAVPEDMERLFSNLIENAVKYSRENGTVKVELEPAADRVRAVIADRGIGIPAEALPRIFDEFYRAANAKEMQTEGTGLGLALCKRIVDFYGGSIAVESVENQGSTFTVFLPLSDGKSQVEGKGPK